MQNFWKWCLAKILSEEFFVEFYADTYDCPSDNHMYDISVYQKMVVLPNIVLIQMMWILDEQKDKKNFCDWFWYGRCRMKLIVLENVLMLLHKSGFKIEFHKNQKILQLYQF